MGFKEDIHDIIRTKGTFGVDDIVKRCKAEIKKAVEKHKSKLTTVQKTEYVCKKCNTSAVEDTTFNKFYDVYKKRGKLNAIEYISEFNNCPGKEAREILIQVLDSKGLSLDSQGDSFGTIEDDPLPF